jgi:hypothetical protein
MSRGAEDRLRELLSERAGTVAPRTDWEERVLAAGRRRRRKRRVGTAAAAAAVVALLSVGANAILSPRAFDDPSIAKTPTATATTQTTTGPETNRDNRSEDTPVPSQSNAPDGWHKLPVGQQTKIPYSTVIPSSAPTWLSIERRVEQLHEPILHITGSASGVVVVTRNESLNENNDTVRYFDNGSFPNVAAPDQRDLDGDRIGGGTAIESVAMSADGRRVAWTSGPTQGNDEPVFQVVDLATRELVATVPLPSNAEFAGSITFLGDAVVASGDGNAYIWRGGSEAEPWLLGGRQVRVFHGASESARIALVFDGDANCMKAVSLTNGIERWRKCPGIPWKVSPDGRYLAGEEEGWVMIRSAETGVEVARHRVPGTFPTSVEWETSTTFIAVLGSDKPRSSVMVRCPVDDGGCEAVPSLLAGEGDGSLRLARRPGS